jgi:cephalosporin hydroxylase
MYKIEDYLKLSEFAKNYNYGNIINEIKDYFGYLHDKNEIDDLGLKLQICIKPSNPMYLHGYVITSALYKYLIDNNYDNISILETGTARGFSSICMSKILDKLNKNGNIYTIDYIDLFDNCLKSVQLNRKITINECVEEWKDLVNKYITFIKGDSNIKIQELNKKLERIHFAFLDGAHYYKNLKNELEFVEKKQQVGDVIICDDYTKTQFPEICKAIDEFLGKNNYNYKIFYGYDGNKKRGYVYMNKKK